MDQLYFLVLKPKKKGESEVSVNNPKEKSQIMFSMSGPEKATTYAELRLG
jgi:hypothetical protein